MIHVLKKFYRDWQLRNLFREFDTKTKHGDNFSIDSVQASLFNESGDPERIRIGHHTRINGTLYCKSKGTIEIGNYCVIQNGALIGCLNSVKIGNYVGIAQKVVIVDNNNHRVEPEERVKHRIRVAPGGPGYPGFGDGQELAESSPIVIEDVAWIGTESVILKGVTIGEGAVVARNAIVTKDVEPYTIVAGNPAKKVKVLEKPDYDYLKDNQLLK